MTNITIANTFTLTLRGPTMQAVPSGAWIPFLEDFTRRNRGTHGRLEVLDGEAGYIVETENKPFEGVAVDAKDGEQTVWISFGATPDDHLTHGVPRTTALYTLGPSESTGEILAAEASDGSRTVLYLSNPGDFALPSA